MKLPSKLFKSKKLISFSFLLITISAKAEYYRSYQNSDDNFFLIAFLYIGLIIALTIIGSERKIGTGWSLVITIFGTPIIGAVVVLSSPRKDIIEFQDKLIETQEEIIKHLKEYSKI